MFYALSHALITLSRCYRAYPLSRSLSFAIALRLAKQVDVVGQLLRRVLHLIFQLLLLRRTHPSGESGPYRSKIDGRVMSPDHRQGMHHDEDNDISVEAFEVLPRRLALVK